MPNVGLGELMVIILIGLLVFGPNKLPEMMRNIGKAFRAFQAETQKAANVIKEGMEEKPAAPAAGVVETPDPVSPPVAPMEQPKPADASPAGVGETAAETVSDHAASDHAASDHAPPVTAADPTRLHEDT